jgi:hypothetical protein
MNTIRRTESALSWLMLVVMILFSVGCRGPWSKDWKFSDMFDLDKATPWGDDGPEEGTPVRLVGTWTDTVLHQSGKAPQRGFGGRLIFYGEDSNDPILVDGQLVVYAFDETNREPTDNKPTRRYVFPPDQVARRMSQSELGPSYSFWLPWDEAGGPQTEVSLIARFQPKDGAVVIGEQTRHLLPGELAQGGAAADNKPSKLPEGIPMRPRAPGTDQLSGVPGRPQLSSAAPNATSGGEGVQLASYEAATAPSQRRMITTSISLPDSFRLRGGAATATVQGGSTAAASPSPPASRGITPTVNGLPPSNAVPSFQIAARPVPPIPSSYPAFAPPPQSPVGNGFVAPTGQSNFAQPTIAQMPQSLDNFAQPPFTSESGWTTTVSYSPVAGPAGPAVNPHSATPPQPSSGSQPPPPPAPATPVFR